MKRTAPKTGKATPAALIVTAEARKAGTSAKKTQKPAAKATKSAAPSKAALAKAPPVKTPVAKSPTKSAPPSAPPSAPNPLASSSTAPIPSASNGHAKNGASTVVAAPISAPSATSLTESSGGLLAAIADIPDAPPVLQLVDDLASGKPGPMANASRVLEEWLGKKPEVLVPAIDRLIGCINSPHKRVAQTAALALPVMGRLAPARVARHLPALTDKFPECSDVAKDGLVATFAALCTASVAYQKRLEPVLDLALSSADPKTLLRWAEVVLPSLKGEPHARARSVVESRLPSMPRPQAQPIATFLGIKLRPLPV